MIDSRIHCTISSTLRDQLRALGHERAEFTRTALTAAVDSDVDPRAVKRRGRGCDTYHMLAFPAGGNFARKCRRLAKSGRLSAWCEHVLRDALDAREA